MRFIKPLAVLILMIFILPYLSGCVHSCTEEISRYVSPSEKTINFDEGFQINVDGTTCGGRKKANLDWYFESENKDIAVVDSEGYVTGKSTGNTRIAVSIGKTAISDERAVGISWVDITVK